MPLLYFWAEGTAYHEESRPGASQDQQVMGLDTRELHDLLLIDP
jgi:hypothetical protein